MTPENIAKNDCQNARWNPVDKFVFKDSVGDTLFEVTAATWDASTGAGVKKLASSTKGTAVKTGNALSFECYDGTTLRDTGSVPGDMTVPAITLGKKYNIVNWKHTFGTQGEGQVQEVR